jgi:hypothetical protein
VTGAIQFAGNDRARCYEMWKGVAMPHGWGASEATGLGVVVQTYK